jgi:hypothetical protein
VKNVFQALALVMLALLCGCGAGKTQDMMSKIDKAQTGDEVRSALGKPDTYDAKEIPIVKTKIETLVYKGSDGELTVILNNNKVFSKSASSGGNK